ncbi:hypothetical protein SDC9_187566 [bioreactor metagenome]|uniref:Uncharacterized protein n=1 Tax=bioreactor metagenome TaxID=1076179 RepID=A0A645HLX7_9ZZZZ
MAAEEAEFKQGLVLLVVNGLDCGYNLALDVYQPVNIAVYLCLKIHNFRNGVRHRGHAMARVVRHASDRRGAFFSQFVQGCNLL